MKWIPISVKTMLLSIFCFKASSEDRGFKICKCFSDVKTFLIKYVKIMIFELWMLNVSGHMFNVCSNLSINYHHVL